jgi:HEAT repeat protein
MEDRKAISQHTKDLAGVIQDNPNSEQAQGALAELIGILNGDWRFARCQASYALGELGASAAPAVPDLMRAAICGDDFVEEASVRALSSIGNAAAPAVDLLIEKIEFALSTSSDGLETWHAADGLGNIGEPALKAIPVLKKALAAEDRKLADRASEALMKLDPHNTANHLHRFRRGGE